MPLVMSSPRSPRWRRNEKFNHRNLLEEHPDYPYKNAYIVVVSKKHIKCITVKELESGNEITPTSKNWLGNRKEFEDLDREKIKDLCEFAVQFFENV